MTSKELSAVSEPPFPVRVWGGSRESSWLKDQRQWIRGVALVPSGEGSHTAEPERHTACGTSG